MIHRGAHKGQPQCDVDAFTEAGVFQHRQALVVIHGQHGIGALQHKGLKERVGRIGAVDIHAAGAQCFQRGDNDVDFFMPQMAAFAGVRVEAGNEDIRVFHAEFAAQILRQNGGHRFNQRPVDGGGDVFKRQMGGGQSHAQAAAGQHHHHLTGAAFFGQVFGVAGKGDAGIVENAFIQRRSHQRGKFARVHALIGAVEQLQHIRRIFYAQTAGFAGRGQGDVQHFQHAGGRCVCRIIILQLHVFAQCLGTRLQ